MRTTFIFILYALLLTQPPASAQEQSFVFSHLKESDGLSDNIINCFFKDSREILWIGTYNGFNRYDGSNFFVYKKRKGANSMTNEVIHSLCEDKEGNIWGATDNGVFRFDPVNDQFANYNLRNFGVKAFFNIVSEKNGNIWAAGQSSLFKFDPKAKKFNEIIKLTSDPGLSRDFQIRKNGMQLDPSGKGLWLATRKGIMFCDTEKNTVINFQSHPGDSLFVTRSTAALSLSENGHMWFFNNDQKEIIAFDPVSKKIIQRICIQGEMPTAEGATTFEDKNHRLWFSSWNYKMLLVDLVANNKIIQIKHQQDDSRTIASNFFWAAFQDDNGTLWIGTPSGISRCDPERNIYNEYHLPQRIPELKESSIQKVEEDPADKSFWIFTSSLRLIHYYPENEKYELFDVAKAEPRNNGAIPGAINAINFFKDLVIITTYTGAWQLKKGTKKIVPYVFLPAAYKDFLCSEIVVIGDSVIYCNNGKQLLYWNYLLDKSELITYLPDPTMPTDRTILVNPVYTREHKLWALSYNSHIAFKDGNRLIRVKFLNDEIKEEGVALNIEPDAEGNLWLLNKGTGLYHYFPASHTSKFWDETDGMPSNRMQKIKVDHAGRVWGIFYNKVSVFIPGPERFYIFKIPISEGNLNYSNHLSLRSNGNLVATINNELVELIPDRIEAIPAKTKPEISQLSANGKDFALLKKSEIRLSPDQNTIRLRFGSRIYKDLFPYDIQYMLEGAEKAWTTVVGNSEALYNNLHPGNYKFRVRVRGKNNSWLTEEATLFITIKTPFYKTIGFLVAIGLLIIGTLFFLYRYRLAQKEKVLMLESKAQRLEKEKVMVMYESLKQQLNPHFLFNSLTSLSGLIETDQQVAGNFLEQMSGIYRYILKNGDNETVSLKDEIEFVQLYINLQQTRFKKGLIVNINVPDEYLHYKIAPVTLQNLIENAIKHNIIDADSPLVIDIFIEDDFLVVRNNLQKKNMVETSNKKGLAQFVNLYKYLSRKPVHVEESTKDFTIKIPLV